MTWEGHQGSSQPANVDRQVFLSVCPREIKFPGVGREILTVLSRKES